MTIEIAVSLLQNEQLAGIRASRPPLIFDNRSLSGQQKQLIGKQDNNADYDIQNVQKNI